ncbi:MAG: alginate O-acetyltransferase complex protein AlgI [Bacteroidia bacterium]|jgi:alginate O-acetyltransferase complex protein AlgI
MVFSGLTFLFYFFPLFFIVYYLLPKSYKNYWLLAGSIFFYAWGAPKFVFVLLASTVIDYYIVRQLYRATQSNKKKWLITSISLNLGLLAYFKYANFFADNVNTALSVFSIGSIPLPDVILPIGISFYTFQTLTYSIDIYRGNNKPLKSVSDYVLYIMMFPQLIAGPIVRFGEIAKQITSRVVSNQNIVEGFIRFCIGLGKKVLIANTLAVTADTIFNLSPNEWTTSVAWLGIILFTFQIYFDFAGYSDMAIGLGKMLGFKFPENFNAPYTSISITEFWRKWHITLGTFMRDYLYKPLGGNRSGVSSTYRNLFIVFLLSGLWHGASWNFVLWGVYHGAFLVFERLTGLSKSISFRIPRILFTFIIVVLGWVVFRIDRTADAFTFYQNLFRLDFVPTIHLYHTKMLWLTSVAVLFSFFPATKIGKKWMSHFYNQDYRSPALLLYFSCAIVILVLSIASLSTGSFNPFIYFRF